MASVAKKYQDELPRIKKNVQEAWEYFSKNYDRFHYWQNFIFMSSLSDTEVALLNQLGKPPLEFNILEAFISRLRGEFSKQEPSIEVFSDYDQAGTDVALINTIEGHFRHLEAEARKDGTAFNVYTDQTSGGFSVFEVYTQYKNEKSMDQVIGWRRVFDPCLCFFDPLARLPHKADARWWGQCYPKLKTEIEEEFDVDLSGLSISTNLTGFNWSYRNQKSEEVLLLCDYYEKKKKKLKLVQISDERRSVMTVDEYKEFQNRWVETRQLGAMPVVIKERTSTETTICRYRLIQDRVLEYTETSFKYPNLIFVDGNSAFVRKTTQAPLQQEIRPYPYHAEGAQKLKNFAGQTLANELENMVQHKWIAPIEGIPEGHEDAYTNVQKPTTLLFNAFRPDSPDTPLPPPQAVPRAPAPPEIYQGFMVADQTVQSILGSYDASLGINDNQLSGVAIVEGATQSNAAAMPYVVNYIQALNQVAQVVLDLIPKYYVTPRTIPVVDKEGKRTYARINQRGSIPMQYEPTALNIRVEAGVNFAIQKNKALTQLIQLSQAMPTFGEFINSMGLMQLVDNLEIIGADQLKDLAKQFMIQKQKMAAMQQQMAQQQMMNNPLMLRAQNERMKIAQTAQQNQVQNQLKAAELSIGEQEMENDRLKILADIDNNKQDAVLELDKHQTEKTRAAVDLAIATTDQHHRHAMEHVELAHNMTMDHLTHELAESQAKERSEPANPA